MNIDLSNCELYDMTPTEERIIFPKQFSRAHFLLVSLMILQLWWCNILSQYPVCASYVETLNSIVNNTIHLLGIPIRTIMLAWTSYFRPSLLTKRHVNSSTDADKIWKTLWSFGKTLSKNLMSCFRLAKQAILT